LNFINKDKVLKRNEKNQLETNITKETLELKLEKLVSEEKYMECEAIKKKLQELELLLKA
tara:strand:+ start:354 stop:533 length:180 start_codon:yes stop_codon:yes gene_type:complete